MPRASKPEAAKRRRVVAQGVVAGKKTREIAKDAGCGERQVERIAGEPATQFLIADLMRPHHARLAELAEKAVTAVDAGLTAVNSKGRALHEIQLRAVGRFGDLLHLAQGEKPPDPTEGGLVTWEQFVVLYRTRQERVPGQEAA